MFVYSLKYYTFSNALWNDLSVNGHPFLILCCLKFLEAFSFFGGWALQGGHAWGKRLKP